MNFLRFSNIFCSFGAPRSPKPAFQNHRNHWISHIFNNFWAAARPTPQPQTIKIPWISDGTMGLLNTPRLLHKYINILQISSSFCGSGAARAGGSRTNPSSDLGLLRCYSPMRQWLDLLTQTKNYIHLASRTIENAKNKKTHMVLGFGMEGAGASGTMENYWNTNDLYGFALWGGGRRRLHNLRKLLKYQRFIWFCVVGWGARVPPEQ